MKESKSQTSTPASPSLSRRRLFAAGSTVGALAAAAAAVPLVAPTEPPKAEPKPAPEKGGGYQLSEHVKRYYQTARV